jgi:hypothetical protein
MNENIQKLLKESTYNILGVPQVDQKKFAQLIVRECIQNIRDNMEHARVDTLGDRDLFLETLRTSGHFYITELEQHFGVKE